MKRDEYEALIGELIMPRLNVDAYVQDKDYAETIRGLVKNRMAGGFCIFGGTADGVAKAVIELQEIAKNVSEGTPLLFSCDCEFGLPMRLTEGGTEFPDAMAIAKTGDKELARKAGQAIAREMRALGISWNFAPVADVNSNSQNPIINTRSFGENPETVAEFATAFMFGLQSESVAASAKHFPGHGDTSVDSHSELPVIERSWESFESLELPPFKALIKSGVWSVMTGHLAAPKLAEHLDATADEQYLPATLSHALTSTLLREQLGFEGVIVTDALEMRAITEYFGADEAALVAIEAGANVLLLPLDPVSTFKAIKNALTTGRISIEEVKKRIERVRLLKEKTRVDIFSIHPESLAELAEAHNRLANQIAVKAIEITGGLILSGANVVILADSRPDATLKAKMFETLIHPFVSEVKMFTSANWSKDAMEMNSDTILVTLHRARGYVQPANEAVSIRSIVQTMAASFSEKNIVPRGMILFGSPYLDSEFIIGPRFVMKTFSESAASIFAATQRLQQKNAH